VHRLLDRLSRPLFFSPGQVYSPAVPRRLLIPVLAVVLRSTPALAQDPVQPPITPGRPDSCATGPISYIFIDNKSIFDTSDPALDRRLLWAYRLANSLHVGTRRWVIRRELLFAPGSCYDPFLLEETERLLRNYTFLSRVDVFGTPQPDGTYHVIVSTRDEWSTRVDVRFSSGGDFALEGVRLTEENLFGTGQSAGVFYYEREVTRDYGISYFTPQVAGTRWDISAAAGRTRAGTFVRESVAYPFVGEVGRWASRQAFRHEDQYFNYIVRDDPALNSPHVLQPLREKAFDVALVRRTGQRGNSSLIGAALSFQNLSYPDLVQIAPEGDFNRREPAPDSLAEPVLGQRETLANIRAFALLGRRNVWWIRRRGLDSMRGQEDVRLGAEAVLGLGRSIPSLETDDDLYTTLALYAGMQLGDVLALARARGDGRRDLTATAGAPEWEDVYVEGELLSYLQSARLPRQTIFFRTGLSGGWNTRTPFQLTLGGVHGVRGYDTERFPGGRRLIMTLEDRFYVGWPARDVIDLGGTVFVDAGRIWAGDAPFGIDSGWRAGAGIGLRASFPAGARSTYRIDVGWPLERTTRLGDFRLTMSVGEPRGLLPEEDLQLIRSRSQNIGGELFTFRN
jgi:hypothetical protein